MSFKDANHTKSVVSGSTPIQGEPIKRVPSGAPPLSGCKVALEVNERGSFSLTAETGNACAQEIAKTAKLGVETQKYLLSHIKSSDSEIEAQLAALKKRRTNGK